ncbi:MAG TPA: hypothetical protein VFG69_19685 [Nannocystaceae bacterium]|nr:hypothetical protein [Nannocystaceae bacterium]
MLNFSVKAFFRAPPGPPATDAAIAVFHGWIRDAKITDDVLIDVADYGHVKDGPGVLLVCHEGHYVIDHRGGRPGLAYHRKRGPAGTTATSGFVVALGRLWHAAELLAGEPTLAGSFAFDKTTLCVRVLDRLRAPNDDAGFAEMNAALADGLRERFGALDLAIERDVLDPRDVLTAWIRTKGTAELPLP